MKVAEISVVRAMTEAGRWVTSYCQGYKILIHNKQFRAANDHADDCQKCTAYYILEKDMKPQNQTEEK